MDERYLTITQVADRLNLHPQTIRKMIGKGYIHAIRTCGAIRSHYRISETELKRVQDMGLEASIKAMEMYRLERSAK